MNSFFRMTACVATMVGAVAANCAPVIQIKSVERTSAAIVIRGTVAIVPPDTAFEVEVLSINGKLLGDRHKIMTIDKVRVNADRTFEAQLQRYGSLGGFPFPKGQYQVEFSAHFNTVWQTPEVARAVGVELDDQGRTGVNSEPSKLPVSEDLRMTGPNGARKRVLRAIRTVSVGESAVPTIGLGKTQAIRLEIHDTNAARNPLRTVNADNLLFREAKQAAGQVSRTQAVVLTCIGPFPAGRIADDLYRPGGRVNASLGGDYATTLREMCLRMEQACNACR